MVSFNKGISSRHGRVLVRTQPRRWNVSESDDTFPVYTLVLAELRKRNTDKPSVRLPFSWHHFRFKLGAIFCRYRVVPSPLPALKWWRVVVDEAHMVESTTQETAKMALKLPATFR